jgi:WD40 repeat protein
LVDIRSDLYSLGGTMFVLLTAKMMFDATTLVQKLKKHLLEVPPLAHKVRPGIPPTISAVVAKLLEKRPEDRYQTPQDLIHALEEIEAGRGESPATGKYSRPTMPELQIARPPEIYSGHSGAIYSLAVAPNGKFLVSGGSDESIQVWDVDSRRALKPLPNKGGAVVALAISPDSKTAASAAARIFDDPNQVDVWEISSGKFLGKLKGMKNPIQCLAFSQDGRKIAAGSEDGAIMIWTLDGKTPTLRLPGHKSNVTAIQFLAGDERLLTACKDGSLALWDLTTAKARGAMPGTVGPIRGMVSSGNRIALAGNQVRLRHGDGSFVNFNGNNGPVECIAVAPGRMHILGGGSDGSVLLWQIENPTPIEEFPKHGSKTRAVAFAPDGKSIFSTGEDGLIRRCFPK